MCSGRLLSSGAIRDMIRKPFSEGDIMATSRINTFGNPVEVLTGSTWFGYIARIVLTFAFWGSGLAKLIDFQGGVAEMAHFGLEPAIAFNIATIITQIGGSALIILNRWTWLGAGALAVFTLLTIPISHHFWTM